MVRIKPFKPSKRGYYFKVIVREYQKAYRSLGVIKSLKEIDLMLRWYFLYYEVYDVNCDKWEKRIHTLRSDETKVTDKMMDEFFLQCIKFAIENMDWAIPMILEEMDEKKMTDHQKICLT